MNINEVINFKNDLEKGHYISAIELIEIVESFNEGIKPKDLVSFLEVLNIFTMRLHPFSEYEGSIDYGYPEVDEKIGRKIANFLYLRENRAKDERLHNLYINEIYKLENICWNRADLLRVEGFVNNTDIVRWGKKHILQRMYCDMTGENLDVVSTFAESTQQAIFKELGRTPLNDNLSAQPQTQITDSTNDEMQAKITDLEKQLKQAHADNDLLRKEIDDNKKLEPSTISAVTRLLNVLFYRLDYDLNAHSGTLNKQLIEYSKHPSVNTKISKGFLVPWLKRVQQLRIDTETGSHDRHAPL